ncbi:MAG: ABC transporter ATP-binding protein [Clostridiales bacterium]|nr:ABC transporter ATP-binding protein [Clostridiales bacterium]
MIEVRNLTKTYFVSKRERKKNKMKNEYVRAVENVSFSVRPGEIYALLGPNGAGKTTTLRCMSTLIKPSSGEIIIDGFDVQNDSESVRENISFLTNELKLDEHFSADYTMKFFGGLRNMLPEQIDLRKNYLFDIFGIEGFKNKQISDFSTGMKQKLGIAVSLLNDPEVIIFDEPTNGLDILTAKTVTDYLLDMKEQGKTIIISTHVMRVAEKLSDRIGILIGGHLIIEGTLKEILEKTETETLDDAFFALYEKFGDDNG